MDNIRLGVSATITGRYSLQGIDSFNGLKLFTELINSEGGLTLKERSDKLALELIHYDDGSDSVRTSENTRKLITEHDVDILLGPYSSSLALAAAKVSESFDRVLWNYGGSSDEISTSGFEKVVTTITPASRYFEQFLRFISAARKEAGTVGIVFAEDSGFSSEVAKGALLSCNLLGLECKKFSYLSGNSDFTEIYDKLQSEDIRIVLGVGRFEDDVNLARSLKEFSLCLVGAGIDEFNNQLGQGSEGVYAVTQWEPGIDFQVDFGPTSKQFRDMYKNKYSKAPDYPAAQAFNMGLILSEFIERIGSYDENKLMEKISESKFCTFYGSFEFDQNSSFQIGHKTIVSQWQNGIRELVFPSEIKTAEAKYLK